MVALPGGEPNSSLCQQDSRDEVGDWEFDACGTATPVEPDARPLINERPPTPKTEPEVEATVGATSLEDDWLVLSPAQATQPSLPSNDVNTTKQRDAPEADFERSDWVIV